MENFCYTIYIDKNFNESTTVWSLRLLAFNYMCQDLGKQPPEYDSEILVKTVEIKKYYDII